MNKFLQKAETFLVRKTTEKMFLVLYKGGVMKKQQLFVPSPFLFEHLGVIAKVTVTDRQ